MNAARWFQRREDYQPPKTPPESPFRKFDVKFLACGSYQMRLRLESRSEAWRSIAFLLGHWQLRGYGMWAAEDKQTGEFVGRIGLHNPEGWPVFEVGWLIDRARWGEGLATEGGAAAMQFAFERLHRDHISSVIQPKNNASIRVAEKLGMKRESSTQIDGIDVVIYGRDRQASS